ncbi:hypothetical protein KCP75_17180 [Salmonella enterica subsp. enterica]|nr:hypothetical protein KCP75_17180 [Salmonella enterica subsp. enterica]
MKSWARITGCTSAQYNFRTPAESYRDYEGKPISEGKPNETSTTQANILFISLTFFISRKIDSDQKAAVNVTPVFYVHQLNAKIASTSLMIY